MMRTPRSLFLLCSLLLCGAPAAQPFPYQDASLSPEQRADDLLGRLSLQQKVSLMMNASPAIPEFGIREYNWWSEALHGAARAGLAEGPAQFQGGSVGGADSCSPRRRLSARGDGA